MLDILKKWDRDETVDYDKMTRIAVREENALQVKVKKELFALFSKKEENIRITFTSADQAEVCVVIVSFSAAGAGCSFTVVCVCARAVCDYVLMFLPLSRKPPLP